MRQINKDISLKIDGQDLSFRLTKLDAFSGVSLQKVPDRTFDRTGTNLTYTLLAATITEQ